MTTRPIPHLLLALAICLSIISCSKQEETPDQNVSLAEARSGFKTALLRKETADFPAEEPPARLFELVQYQSSDHEFPAYLSPDPGDGEKHPAIIWMVGGFHNSISGNAFEAGPRENDQSGATFRKAGILMMYPSMRGGNENEGSMEGFYGEVDDVLAAADYLNSLDYVDPERIYLGGHSTGGTLAILAAAAAPEKTFRAVFALGPIDDPVGYGEEHIPYDPKNAEERKLRAPIRWLHSIAAPTLVFEGEDGNADSLRAMKKANSNPLLSFFEIGGAGHFDIIAPVSELIAKSILTDTEADFRADISVAEIKRRLTRLIPPPRSPFPAGDPRSDQVEFELAVYLPEELAEPAAMRLVEGLVKSNYPELNWTGPDQPPADNLEVLTFLIEDVAESYAPPSVENLRYSGHGLTPEQGEQLQHSPHAISLVFRAPGDRAADINRHANRLIAELAEAVDGFPWDEKTRQVFSVDGWKEMRIEGWDSDLPDIQNHVTVHAYRSGEHIRAITLGMAKFGLPDVVIDQFSQSQTTTMGSLLNCFCQLMAEGAQLDNSDDFELDIEKIRHEVLRQTELDGLLENARGKARLALKQGPWEWGDPDNRIIEIAPDHYEGPDLFSRQDALLSECFGSQDEITMVDHDDATLQAASARARAKLHQLKEDHQSGLEPGEYILVKAPFAVPGGGNEYMWVEVLQWGVRELKGSLRSDPFDIPNLRAGQEVTISEKDIFDYIRRFADGTEEGNETGKLIRKITGEN